MGHMAEAAPVPFAAKLSEVYPPDHLEKVRPRWKSLLRSFLEQYNHKPDLVARSPGRVNLIGEHIDYSLYSVLPMAVCVDSLIAIRAIAPSASALCSDTHTALHICNVNNEKFPSQEISIPSKGEIAIDPSKHLWTNYFMAGLIGAIKLLRKRVPHFHPRSMQVLVDGTVPAGGGLSSSAAFVCASLLAVVKAHGYDDVSQEDLFELAIVSERLVGVNSGGMDQAASIFARANTVLSTSFYPKIEVEYVEVPITQPQMVFLVAQSFVTADKHVTAPRCYNLRVVECTLAAAVLAAKHDVPIIKQDKSPLGYSLRSFQESLQSKGGKSRSFDAQLGAMVQMTKDCLIQEDGYTREDISSILGVTVDELESRYMAAFPIQAEKFMLRQRALHVFSEALRVLRFKEVLSDSAESNKMSHLGTLMNQTQDSCRDLYDCSCPELDELCRIALGAGAVGSRLTGAGWGGCTVHLVPGDKVEDVIAAWKVEYYGTFVPQLSEEMMEEAVVVSVPSSGAFVISPEAC